MIPNTRIEIITSPVMTGLRTKGSEMFMPGDRQRAEGARWSRRSRTRLCGGLDGDGCAWQQPRLAVHDDLFSTVKAFGDQRVAARGAVDHDLAQLCLGRLIDQKDVGAFGSQLYRFRGHDHCVTLLAKGQGGMHELPGP